MIKNISVFGYSQVGPEDKLYQDAFDVSKVLAEAGYTIVNGGGPGVMRASSEGAKAGGGKSIGITFSPVGMSNFEGQDTSNPADETIMVPNYVERTLRLLEYGDVYIIFNGGTGTISEFGMAWGLARLYFGHHKPLILYGQFWQEIIETMDKNMLLRKEEKEVYKIVTTPQEVLVLVRELDVI
jgi:uncharacterized protein (TIGR00730 family)